MRLLLLLLVLMHLAACAAPPPVSSPPPPPPPPMAPPPPPPPIAPPPPPAMDEIERRMAAEAAARERNNDAELARARAMAMAEAEARARAQAQATQDVRRYANLERPRTVAAGSEFTVLVSLTIDLPDQWVQVQAAPGVRQEADGALILPLPAADQWTFDVVLSAPQFDFVGDDTQRIVMTPDDDSTPARFRLRATGPVEAGRITATVWHQGEYLLRMRATVEVLAPGTRAIAAAPVVDTRAVSVGEVAAASGSAPDITIFVLDGDPMQIIVNSPYTAPVVSRWQRPEGFSEWLAARYQQIVIAQQSVRGMRLAGESGDAGALPSAILLEGLGQQLYDRFAPEAFRRVLATVSERHPERPLSIQIYTADPLFPWELMKIPGSGPPFLGARHAVARWHVSDAGGQLERPPQSATASSLQVIAPEYDAARRLAAREIELSSLRTHTGNIQMLPTDTLALLQRLTSTDAPFIHFIGHGHVRDRDFYVDLQDGRLDHVTWRGLVERIVARGGARPFLFLNACEVGQQSVSAGFVDGWAPATLEAGGSGFIGALWPVDDAGAAYVSDRFYAELGSGKVTEVLRRIRAGFGKTGDPTALAYVYYGDARLDLRITR